MERELSDDNDSGRGACHGGDPREPSDEHGNGIRGSDKSRRLWIERPADHNSVAKVKEADSQPGLQIESCARLFSVCRLSSSAHSQSSMVMAGDGKTGARANFPSSCLEPAMRIHFVCTGNVYRSRLAEAYCISRAVPGIRVFSSGIAAGVNGDASISPYAIEVLNRYGLLSSAAKSWQQTTAALVKMSDVLILMESEHRRFCANWIELPRQRVEVWGIEDIGPSTTQKEIAETVEQTFKTIRQRTDALLSNLGLSDANRDFTG